MFRIVQMNTSDVPAVAAIEAETPNSWSKQQLEAEILQETGFHFVARNNKDDLVAGFIIGRLIGDEAEILRLAVTNGCRRQGVGGTLLDAALEWLIDNGAAVCYLELRASNRAASGLYRKHGFSELALRKGYYTNPPEDAIIMTNKLNAENTP